VKLASFTRNGGVEIGVVEGGQIVPLDAAASMMELIARWPAAQGAVRAAAQDGPRIALGSVRLLPPIPRPGKILAIGLNYADHIREMGHEMPTRQVWFSKPATAANGPYDPIRLPRVSSAVDYEAELVAVIGQGGRNIPKERVADSVFGYCCGNDVTARDWQRATSQWMLGKGFDSHAPFGPWITTADEVGDPHALGVRSFVNGEKRQDSNTCHFVFDVWEQIAHVSEVMTLEPGDLIFTGTPGGVGMGFEPPKYLAPGDIVRVEIDKLGALEARCQEEE